MIHAEFGGKSDEKTVFVVDKNLRYYIVRI